MLPFDNTVAIMANTNPLRTDVLESRIARTLMHMPEKTVIEAPMSLELRTYAATYLVTDAKISHRSDPTEITFRDGALHAARFRPIHTATTSSSPSAIRSSLHVYGT